MQTQLPLPVQLPDEETFSTFIFGENQQIVEHLQHLIEPSEVASITYINGDYSTGKSHLLYAVCAKAEEQGVWATYLNLADVSELAPEILSGLETCRVVCLDNVDALAGQRHWQVALFDLINRVLEQQSTHLIFTASVGASVINLELPDLNSRLAWGTSFMVKPLNDSHCVEMLRQRAGLRGMKLSAEVGQYLLTRGQRDTRSLIQNLNHLDKVSLQQQRKLTIPFVKQALLL